MSYDYILFRFTRPISSYEEMDEDVVGVIDTTENIMGVISSLFPKIIWDSPSHGNVPDHHEGRLEFGISEEEGLLNKMIFVQTSFGVNSIDTIKSILKAFNGLVAFDQQTMELIYEN